MNIKFLNHEKFKKKLKNSISEIDKFLNHDSGDVLFVDNKVTSNLVQKYAFFNSDNIHNKIIKPILLDASTRSEMLAGGSGDLCLMLLSQMLSSSNNFNNFLCDIEKSILKKSKRANRDDFDALIRENSKCEDHLEILNFLFENMNTRSPIFIERSVSNSTYIKFDSGFSFNIPVDKKYITQRTSRMRNVRCFVIDGYIESVGEIHHLLENAASTKENYMIFCRHISEDVMSTISYNIQRGTISLVPVAVGFDEKTLNILNDISLCTNSDLIAAHKGDLISKSVRKDPSIVDMIDISEKSISIVNKNPSELLDSHLKYLRDKRNKSSSEDSFNLIESRIKNLSCGKILISIGTDLYSKEKRTVEIFDKILRETKSIIESGVVYKEDILENSEFLSELMIDRYPYSTLSLIVSLRNSLSAYNSIKSIHGVIYEDRDSV